MAAPRTNAHTLNDVARQLAPHLHIISASQPTATLRTYNVIAIAESAEQGRDAVLALESIENQDEKLGTVVMGSTAAPSTASDHDRPRTDPEGVTRQVLPRILIGGFIGALVGALVIGGAALLLGAEGWEILGAALAGAMLISVFGAIWVTFAGFGGSDAYRQTFVDNHVTELALVSVHTDDADEAAAVRERLQKSKFQVLDVDRRGHISPSGSAPHISSA